MSIVTPTRPLGKRLEKLNESIAPDYQHIWDCCCDHGLLGMSLLERKVSPNVHFVDVVPQLIDSLSGKLTSRFGSVEPTHFHLHCLDAAKLPITDYPGKHLIVIAGVGGDLTTQIVCDLYQAYPKAQMEFLLCPIRQHYSLRQALSHLNFRVKNECLVEENKRIYEVLWLTPPHLAEPNAPRISVTGEAIWQAGNVQEQAIAEKYLAQTCAHYSRRLAAKDSDAQAALDAFQAIQIQHSK